MSDLSDYNFPPEVILDAAGAPVGLYRDNQDPSIPTRLHAVPLINAKSEPIVDPVSGEPETQMLPYSDPRTVAQLAKEGYEVTEDGNGIIAIEGNKLTDGPLPQVRVGETSDEAIARFVAAGYVDEPAPVEDDAKES